MPATSESVKPQSVNPQNVKAPTTVEALKLILKLDLRYA
jgi:hypothetical protein